MKKKSEKKSHSAEKIERGPFVIFQHPFCRKNPKKIEGGPFGLVRYCMFRGTLFWFSSLGRRVQFGIFLKFCRTFGVELFWSFRVYRKKTLTKNHDYSRLFSLEKRRLKNSTVWRC